MKNTRFSFELRAALIAVLSLSLIIIPFQGSSSVAASTSAVIKTADQYKTEAARFNSALNAIKPIATMKLETGDDLKKAIAILDREREGLKLRLSKYVSMGLSDSTFASAIKKRATNQKTAEDLVNQIEADPKIVMNVEGASSLKTRIEQSGQADAATFRAVSDRLKEASERIRKAAKSGAAQNHAVKKGRLDFLATGACHNSVATESSPQLGVPVVVAVIIIVAIVVVMSVVAFELGRRVNPDLESDIAACQQSADQQYESCVSDANKLPSGFPLFLREAAVAGCYSAWLATQAFCITIVG